MVYMHDICMLGGHKRQIRGEVGVQYWPWCKQLITNMHKTNKTHDNEN